jgi:hypothetical protein
MNLIDICVANRDIQKFALVEILQSNQESQKYGLVLTMANARDIIESRNQSIKNLGRVELGIGIINKIITAFCSSPYIDQDEYAYIICELVETFYYMKNETEDRMGDDELISRMQKFFNTSCQGSLDLLRNRELDLMAINLRRSYLEADFVLERKSWKEIIER